jgi:hypothetical protein
VVACQRGKLSLQQMLVDAAPNVRVGRVGLNFFCDPIQLETFAARPWVQHVPFGGAPEFLLQFFGDCFVQKSDSPIRLARIGRHFFHRHAILPNAEQRFFGRFARFQFNHFGLELR